MNAIQQHGFIALVSVITLAVIALMVTVGSSQIGLSALVRASMDTSAARACMLAEACAEAALYTFVQDIDAPSEEVLALGDSECEIQEVFLIETGLYRVVTDGTDGNISCEIRMDVDTREDRIVIDYWHTGFIYHSP